MSDSLTLWEIQDGLRDVFERHENALARVAELEVIQKPDNADDEALLESERKAAAADVELYAQAVQAYLKEEVRKVDNVAGYIRWSSAMEKAAKEEATRIAERARQWKTRNERVKEFVLGVMQSFEVTRFETALNRIRRQNNSAPSVDITEESAVPAAFSNAEVVMPADLWMRLAGNLTKEDLAAVTVALAPARSRIAAAIKRGTAVPGARLEYGEHLRIE